MSERDADLAARDAAIAEFMLGARGKSNPRRIVGHEMSFARDDERAAWTLRLADGTSVEWPCSLGNPPVLGTVMPDFLGRGPLILATGHPDGTTTFAQMAPAKVYVAFGHFLGRDGPSSIGGVFTSREAAQAECDRRDVGAELCWDVEEYEVKS